MTRAAPVLLLLLASASCTISKDDFPESYAHASCKKSFRCDRERFNDTWDSTQECRERTEENIDVAISIGDLFADYDEEGGWSCVRQINTLSCEDWKDGEADCDVLN